MKNLTLTLLCIALLTLTTLSLSGCGFHLRSSKQVPAALHSLYLDSPDTQDDFNAELRQMLSSLNIHLSHNKKSAPITLTVSKVEFTHNNPNFSATNQAISFTYTMKVTASLVNSQGKTLTTRSFSNSDTLTTNVNQIHIPSTANLIQQSLQRETINQIFFWLTNQDTATALQSTANTTRTEQHAT